MISHFPSDEGFFIVSKKSRIKTPVKMENDREFRVMRSQWGKWEEYEVQLELIQTSFEEAGGLPLRHHGKNHVDEVVVGDSEQTSAFQSGGSIPIHEVIVWPRESHHNHGVGLSGDTRS